MYRILPLTTNVCEFHAGPTIVAAGGKYKIPTMMACAFCHQPFPLIRRKDLPVDWSCRCGAITIRASEGPPK